MNRRHFLRVSAGSALAVSVRSLLTGLPAAFLLTGQTRAQEAGRKFVMLAQSGAGEAVNGFGPGSFDSPDFSHPAPDESDATRDIAGRTFSAADLSATTDFLGGNSPVRIARCFEALGAMQDNMAFFHHRTNFGIHPQMQSAQAIGGAMRGADGRGQEQLASALAQENAVALGSVIDRPIVLSGSVSYENTPLTRYEPTVLKELVLSSVSTAVPSDMFGAARDKMLDRVYTNVRDNGTPNQRRFLDDYVLSQAQAVDVAERLVAEVDEIVDDGLTSQMKMATIIGKLQLAPVAVVGYRVSGDNHVPNGLEVETSLTLDMMASYREFYDFALSNGFWDQMLYATLSVFGRKMNVSNNGRGHNGSLSTGLLFGGQLQRAVVGGINPDNPRGESLPINSTTGGTGNPDVSDGDSFACYAKSVMMASGVPQDRLDARVPDVPAVRLA